MKLADSEPDHEMLAHRREGTKRTVLWAGELCERWGISQVTLWRWRRAGKVPAPDFQRTGWLVATIEAFENGNTANSPGVSASGRAH